jgi:hypothetical protein
MGLKTKTKDLAQNAIFGADSSATTIISPRTDHTKSNIQSKFVFFSFLRTTVRTTLFSFL